MIIFDSTILLCVTRRTASTGTNSWRRGYGRGRRRRGDLKKRKKKRKRKRKREKRTMGNRWRRKRREVIKFLL